MRLFLLLSALLFSVLFTTNISFSATYQTIGNGDWDNPTIWSTNGGLTTCNCLPPIISSTDVIQVYHIVNLVDHIYISSSSSLTVHPSGKMIGPTFKIGVRLNGTVNFYGSTNILELVSGKNTSSTGGTFNIVNTTIEIQGKINLFAGIVNLDGSLLFMHAGNFNIYPNASFYTANGAKVEMDLGNVQNEGLLHICGSCCIESQGNWTNEVTGTVTGSGSAITNVGNIRNYNILSAFSSQITWCSAGTDTGMPTPEDCSTSGSVCGAVQLPLELTLFDGVNRREFNEIFWSTDTESNTDYFILEKSIDAINWENIFEQAGSGNSIASNNYLFDDYHPEYLTYYRLIQVDYNGTEKKSKILSITNTSNNDHLLIYPNPVINQSSISVAGIDGIGYINLYDNYGQIIKSESIQNSKVHNIDISTQGLSSGIYFLEYKNDLHKSTRVQFVIL